MLIFHGVRCHDHCAPWLWWEKKEVNIGMLLPASEEKVGASKIVYRNDTGLWGLLWARGGAEIQFNTQHNLKKALVAAELNFALSGQPIALSKD